MTTRARKVILGFIVTAATGAVTWMLSWFVQYIFDLTTNGPAFNLTSQPVNRLAASTVLAAFAVAVFILILADSSGCLILILWLFVGSSVVAGIAWVATHVFPGTPVSTDAGQIIYGFLVLIWGIALFYAFLSDFTEKALDAKKEE